MRGPIPLISAHDHPTGTVFSALMSALQMREIRLVALLGRERCSVYRVDDTVRRSEIGTVFP